MKILGCGVQPEQLCKDFLVMNGESPFYNDIEFTWNDDADYYVIISFALPGDFYIPSRTIIFQMEPWVYDSTKNWGIKCWPKEWRNPDESKFLHVRKHDKYLNVAQFMFPAMEEINMNRKDKFIAIISEKLLDEGHINRVNFIKYVELLGLDIIDVYGTANHHNFKNYKGSLDSKILQNEYKYVFSVENNREYNYATEKIWESFISYSLCFYDGCPNLNEYVNELSYVPIDCTKEISTLQVMLHAINSDMWQDRLHYIVESRNKVIKEYGFLPIVHKLVSNV